MSTHQVIYTPLTGEAVIFKYPVITISQTALVSQDSTFVKAHRIAITVRGLIGKNFASSAPSKVDNAVLKDEIEKYRSQLSKVGGTCLIQYGESPSTHGFIRLAKDVDISGGPHPNILRIERFRGTNLAYIEWQLTSDVLPKTAYANAPFIEDDQWVDFAYTTNLSIDQNFQQRRVIAGVLQINLSHPLTQGHNADYYRKSIEATIPPIPEKGTWKRSDLNFHLNTTGNLLTFTVTDQQVYTALPNGITGGDLRFRVTSTSGGNNRMNLSGYLEGSPNTSRPQIYAAVQDLINGFTANVIVQMSNETQPPWKMTQKQVETTSYWLKNRVDFNILWHAFGSLPEPLMEGSTLIGYELKKNAEYATLRAIDWFAILSQKHVNTWKVTDEGFCTKLPSSADSSLENNLILAPNFILDLSRKREQVAFAEGTTISQKGGEQIKAETVEATNALHYLDWQQSFQYKTNMHLVFLPILGPYQDIVQVTQNPEIILIITGEATSVGQVPTIPLPPYDIRSPTFFGGQPFAFDEQMKPGDIRAYLIDKQITPHAPTEDGYYRVEWKLTYKLLNASLEADLVWPFTPMIPAADIELSWREKLLGGKVQQEFLYPNPLGTK